MPTYIKGSSIEDMINQTISYSNSTKNEMIIISDQNPRKESSYSLITSMEDSSSEKENSKEFILINLEKTGDVYKSQDLREILNYFVKVNNIEDFLEIVFIKNSTELAFYLAY